MYKSDISGRRKLSLTAIFLLLISLSSISHSTTLIRYDYLGNVYESLRDDPNPTGNYSALNQLRGVFYVKQEELDSPFNAGVGSAVFTSTRAGTGTAIGLFGLELNDGRTLLTPNDDSDALVTNALVSINQGVVDTWRLEIVTGVLDLGRIVGGQPLFSQLLGEQWKRIRTSGGGASSFDGDLSEIFECLGNCSREFTGDEIYGSDRGRSGPDQAILLSAQSITTASSDTLGQWVRNPQLYLLAEDGAILPMAPIPLPAAAWLFISGLAGLVWKGRKALRTPVA